MRFLFINIILLSLFSPTAFGQLTEDAVKSNFIVNMAKFIEWEEEENIERFNIGVLGGDKMFEELKKRANEILLKDKNFDVVQLKKINDIRDIHILYVDKRRSSSMSRILNIATAENILLFSDSCSNSNDIMINLLDLDMPGSQFEINKDNMDKANLYVPNKLLFYGGSEEDLREMYSASERELANSERELANVQTELEEQTAALEKQKEELEVRKKEILTLNNEIDRQKENLASMIAQAKIQQDSLDQKVALLESQRKKLSLQQADIEEQNNQLQLQKQEIEAGNAFLNRQKIDIENQEQKIQNQQQEIQKQTQILSNQTREIQKQTREIEKQQTILYFFIAFFILIAAMIFFILRAYRIKRQANKKLKEKNAAISRQKEEILAQQEQLKLINQKIEKQNENIKSSIYYALTIQQALLPPKEEMAKVFESFVIYRPRDIVSGDFYWMNQVPAKNGVGEKLFISVADCTGHGVPGAFLSMIGIKLLNSIVNERKQYDPKTILEMLNEDVKEALQQEKKGSDDGMDLSLCCIERTNGNNIKITYSGAKRPLYYSNHLTINVVPGDRKTIGGRFFKDQVFTNREIWLNPGDRIYMTTDGIIDQNAPNRQKFGSKRLIKLLGDSRHLPMNEQKEILEKALDDFQQNEKQRDDIALMGIEL